MVPLSAVIIAHNEEARLAACLESVSWCADRVVVDSGSADGTVDVARLCGARVFHRDWTGFVDQKNFAADQALHPWVLSLDADEQCTPELAGEIALLAGEGFRGRDGFRISRLVWFMGRWIRHTDWSPDFQLRLYRRDAGRWSGGRVHESVGLSGSAGALKGRILHYSYEDLEDYLKKMTVYTRLWAQDKQERGKRAGAAKLLWAPPLAFFKSYILKRGCLDGFPGLVVSGLSAASTFFKYARLRERQREP